MNLYGYVGNDPMNKTDPTGLYDCGNDKTCESGRTNAVSKITGTVGELKGLQKSLAHGDKLSASQQKLSNTITKVMGHSAGTNANAIGGLIGAGNKMVDKLNDNSPVLSDKISPTSAYAQRNPNNGGVILYSKYYGSSAQMQASTMAHEAAHDLFHLAQDEGYGESSMNNLSKTYSLDDMMKMPDALAISLGVPRDDRYK
jgi:hypothetical protein